MQRCPHEGKGKLKGACKADRWQEGAWEGVSYGGMLGNGSHMFISFPSPRSINFFFVLNDSLIFIHISLSDPTIYYTERETD